MEDTRTSDNKLTLNMVLTEGRSIQMACKDKSVFVTLIDGLGSLLGKPFQTKEKIADVLLIKEVFELTQLYGRPPVPPPP